MARIGPEYTGQRRQGLIFTPDEIDAGANLQLLVKRGAAVLQRHYPDWGWIVIPDEENLIIDITSRKLNIEFGYRLKVLNIGDDPNDSWAMIAGANVLERFGMHPGPFRPQEERWRCIPKDHRGARIPDMSDSNDSKIKRQLEMSAKIAKSGGFKIITNPQTGSKILQVAT